MISENINKMIMTSMKEGKSLRTETLRAIKNEFLKYTTSGANKVLTEEIEINILTKMVKERKDTVNIYLANNRDDLAHKELAEVAVIEEMLPASATEDDIKNAIQDYINSNGQITQKDMGTVMKYVKSKFTIVDGKLASQIIKSYIS